ncbi:MULTISPECIES: LURP-one-related/scramblase family protein [Levilactobacillus]|uniref:LURP-one-related/scramblase family protein n=1 Tax=Levilactobacillus TaxID=2767886 RepID=UPI00194FF85B|nr:LURP-one-related family protein [Levilactobacillus sp. 244-2]
MHKLYLTQQQWAFKERFSVRDDHNTPVYQVISSKFQMPKFFEILDVNNQVVATVTKKPLSLVATYCLQIGGKTVATIQKRPTFLRPSYDLTAVGLTVTGSLWDLNFEIKRQDQVVGRVRRAGLSLKNKYEIVVLDDDSQLILVGLVLAVDYGRHMAAAAAVSTTF